MVKKLAKFFDQGLLTLLVLTVAMLLIFSIINIVGRYWYLSFQWIDPVNRHLVIVLCFLGASLAIGSNQHIKIDLLQKVLEAKKWYSAAKVYQIVLHLLMLIACYYLYQSSHQFLQQEIKYTRPSYLGFPSHWYTSLFSIGFILMMMRIIIQLCLISTGQTEKPKEGHV
jgi:TRAP-type C4-dicarboxylate transport system permease small subunit